MGAGWAGVMFESKKPFLPKIVFSEPAPPSRPSPIEGEGGFRFAVRLLIMTVVLTFLVLLSSAHAASFSEKIHLTSPSQPVPPLVFEDENGLQHALSDYRGRFVVLNVWATWCAPCVREMPSLDALQKNVDPKKIVVLPLSEDRGDSTVSSFYRTHALMHLPTAIDTAGRAPSALHLPGLPTTLVIDPQGREIARIEGDTDWNAPEVLSYLQGL